ncbi:transposase [Nocardiopsis deserti]|uniref:transposase n=1 Tax=Nocardiopsis deserti TaxID=2605988 RepID=UPI0016803C16|nr:transposase [Nocardiopsis deserti]
MPAPRKYPPELRERAIRMTVEARRDAATRDGAIARTADQLGVNRETLRNWVAQAEVDAGHRPGTTTDQAQRLAALDQILSETANDLDRAWKNRMITRFLKDAEARGDDELRQILEPMLLQVVKECSN